MQQESKLFWNREWERRDRELPCWVISLYFGSPRKLKKGVLHQRDLGGMVPMKGPKWWNTCFHNRPRRTRTRRSMKDLKQQYDFDSPMMDDWFDSNLAVYSKRPHNYWW